MICCTQVRNTPDDDPRYPSQDIPSAWPDHHSARPDPALSHRLLADKVELTLYNGQHKEVGDELAKAFEAKTGIHVNVRKGSSNQLASQVVEEGERSPPT
jgi:hypothetical protein